MEQPSVTEILAIRSILNGLDVIVNAKPTIVYIPILQQVYGVIYFSNYGFITLPWLAGHIGSSYTGPYSCFDSRASP
jgi:hypothetical protein